MAAWAPQSAPRRLHTTRNVPQVGDFRRTLSLIPIKGSFPELAILLARPAAAPRGERGVFSMQDKMRIQQKPHSLHATVTGSNSRENVEGYLGDLLKQCIARNCFR